MTMPSQEVYALRRTRDFLRRLIAEKRIPQKELKAEALSCLHHYPWDMHINERWSDDVCEHGDRRWCGICEKSTLNATKLEGEL